jgi:hypothetical protein
VLAALAGVSALVATVVLAPASRAASWVAVNTIAGSGLSASTETWEASPVDYDGDGDQDVWVGYHDQGGKLWRNDGTGHYTQVAATAWQRTSAEGKVVDRHYCDWADLDRDGRPDAYCSAGRGGANGVKTGRDNELWLQRTPGTFTEVGTAWGAGDVCGRSHYVAILRANADTYPDVFVGNAPPRTDPADPCDNPANGLTSESSKLFLNQAGTSLREATGWGITGNGGVACAQGGDFTGDGRDDLVVCANPTARLYRNGGTSFTDVAVANHLSGAYTDATFADLDRDGDLDLVTSAGRDVGYHLNTGGVLAAEVRVVTVPSGGSVRALAVGDADGDGDLDVYVLVSNVNAGTNPKDRILLNNALTFTSVPVPAAGGIGDKVVALDGNRDGKAEFLVLNGVEVVGPLQRIELRAG